MFKCVYLMCGCLLVYVRMSAGACRCQKRASDPWSWSLEVVVGCPTWVLGSELWSSARAARLRAAESTLQLFKKKKFWGHNYQIAK